MTFCINQDEILTLLCRHRASCLDLKQRTTRLEPVLENLTSRWQDRRLSEALASFDGFCDLMGLRSIQQYISTRNVGQLQDWSSYPLDTEGKALQLQTQAALEVGKLDYRLFWILTLSRACLSILRKRSLV